jgi:UDP-N-acetylmuramoyl-L-alanyl-D-glutamate--2,6-diaminopimelate ligase
MKDLHLLLSDITIKNDLPQGSIQVGGIKIDSREIKSGDIFIAISGTKVDGHQYLEDAASRGASVLIGSIPEAHLPTLSTPYLEVEDTRQVLAEIAAAWFNYPARNLVVIGVTGTDGKTTTVNLIYQMMLNAGLRAGLISTVNAVIGDKVLDTGFHVTTPEAMDVQFYLSEMVTEGITHVVLEATSHGLAQKRVAACEFDIAVYTNITHEHLDYHGDYQGYFNAKAELLRLVADSIQKDGPVNKIAVLNQDDQSYEPLKKISTEIDLSWVDYKVSRNDFQEGIENERRAGFVAKEIKSDQDGIKFSVQHGHDLMRFKTSLIGIYNVSNCLAAAAACQAGLGLDWDAILEGISALSGIPGRMEIIDWGQDFFSIVDFAHTPYALKNAILAARKLTDQRVITVFGSAGLRDREKRRLMAQVSGELADLTVLTAEDPRTESLDDILEEMAEGIRMEGGVEGETFWRIRDRGDAIRFSLHLAQGGDVIMVCGKGHEQSMCFGMTEYPWDDREALAAALAEFLGKEGPDMPYLPTRE